MACSKAANICHFALLQGLLDCLGLHKASHKSLPPTQDIVCLGLFFNTITMTVTLSQEKFSDIMDLTLTWLHKDMATLRELHSLLDKLIYVVHCCPPKQKSSHPMGMSGSQCHTLVSRVQKGFGVVRQISTDFYHVLTGSS